MSEKKPDNEDVGPGSKLIEATSHPFQKIFDEIEDYAIILLNTEGNIINWSKGAEKLKQYKDYEVIGQNFQVFFLAEDRDNELPQRLLDLAASQGRAVDEGWRVRKDQTRFWGNSTLTALHGDQGEIIGFSHITRHVTDQNGAEDELRTSTRELQVKNEALKKSEERYHRMIAEVEDYAIILLSPEGNIENWNAGAEKIKGYTANEIIGRNFSLFYTPEDSQKGLPQTLLAEAQSKGKAIHEGWRVRKDGSRFWGSIVITAVHATDGSIIGFSKVTRDLSERKEAEETMHQYLLELESKNVELEQFAYVASHDLQEPLRKIKTFSDLIDKDKKNEANISKYLAKINASASRMTLLIRSVLNYSRITRSEEEKVETDLTTILEDIISDFELLLAEKNGRIEYEPLPSIMAVPLQMNQLFSNIIGNALKYNYNPPFIKVTSTVVSSDEVINRPLILPDGDYLQLKFSDNGIGFEQHYENLIFSMFQRLHSKEEFSGTGIGLALCKRIMDIHFGHITVRSQPNVGSDFYVYFPNKQPLSSKHSIPHLPGFW
jgi:PAS domain S-box-containing protein